MNSVSARASLAARWASGSALKENESSGNITREETAEEVGSSSGGGVPRCWMGAMMGPSRS